MVAAEGYPEAPAHRRRDRTGSDRGRARDGVDVLHAGTGRSTATATWSPPAAGCSPSPRSAPTSPTPGRAAYAGRRPRSRSTAPTTAPTSPQESRHDDVARLERAVTVPTSATRYASRRAGRALVAGAQDRARAAALARRARGPARPRRRRARRRRSRPTRRSSTRSTWTRIAARERVTRHDVKARIEEFSALAGHEHIHKGMTSRDLTENVEQLQVRAVAASWSGTGWSPRWPGWPAAPPSTRDLVMAGRSHNVAGAGHHARQAVRHRGRRAADRATSGSTTCSRATRCAASRARSAPPQDMLDLLDGDADEAGRARAAGSPRTSASTGC